jgi:hypothetical protein
MALDCCSCHLGGGRLSGRCDEAYVERVQVAVVGASLFFPACIIDVSPADNSEAFYTSRISL